MTSLARILNGYSIRDLPFVLLRQPQSQMLIIFYMNIFGPDMLRL